MSGMHDSITPVVAAFMCYIRNCDENSPAINVDEREKGGLKTLITFTRQHLELGNSRKNSEKK